jgi:ketosteroid isomerase-like protein
MSEENVEVIRRGWDAYARGDLDALLEVFAPEVVTVMDPSGFEARTYEGREGVLQSLSDFLESFDAFEQTPLEFMDAGERVMTRVRQAAKGTSSGVPVSADVWMVFTLRDRKVVRYEFFSDERAAREAAGLSE